MYSDSEIEDAVAAGALAPEQAASLRAFVAARNATPHTSEEHFRVLRGYNDLFIAYACIFALVAFGWIGSLVPIGGPSRGGLGVPLLIPLLVAAGSWMLAELFVTLRRSALAGFLLTFTFGVGVAFTVGQLVSPLMTSMESGGLFAAVAAAIAGVATWGFWVRFRVAVAPSLAIGLGVFAIFAVFGIIFGQVMQGGNVLSFIMFLVGVGVFAYAMSWDMRDRLRLTQVAEVGFWLHGVSAVVMILPLTFLVAGFGTPSVAGGIVLLVLFLVFGLVGLLVDRKVYVLSAIGPLTQALNSFFDGSRYRGDFYGQTASPVPFGGSPYAPTSTPWNGPGGWPLFTSEMATILIAAILLVLLAFFWAPVRRAALGILPTSTRETLQGQPDEPYADQRPRE